MLPNLKILDGKQISTELVRKRKAWAARWAAQHGKKDAGGEKGEEEEAPHAEDGKGKRLEARPAPKKAGEAQEKPAPKAAGKRTREESEKEEGLKGRTQKKTRTEPQNEKPEPPAQAKAAVKVAEQPSKKRSARDEKVDASKPAEPQAKKGRSETEKNNKTTNEPKKRDAPTARANAASAATGTATTKKKPANKFDERSREMRATAGKKSAPKKEPEMEPVEEEKGEIERKLEEHVQLVTGNSGLLEVIKASDTPKSGGQQQPTNKKGKGKAAAAVGQTATSASAKKVQSVLDLMGRTAEPEVGLGVGNAWA